MCSGVVWNLLKLKWIDEPRLYIDEQINIHFDIEACFVTKYWVGNINLVIRIGQSLKSIDVLYRAKGLSIFPSKAYNLNIVGYQVSKTEYPNLDAKYRCLLLKEWMNSQKIKACDWALIGN